MTQYIFSNNPLTTLAAPINTGSTSLSVLAGAGSEFPNPSTGQGFLFTLQKAGSANIFEICLCTSRTGDNFNTVVRAQELTTPLNWNAGDTVTLLITAGGLNSFLQTSVAQPEQYTYSADVGSANNYLVVLTPSLATLYNGQKYRFVAANTNTGNCLFNSASLLLPSGAQIPAGTIVAGGYYEAVYIGGTYQLNLAFNYGNVTFTNVALAPTPATSTNTGQIATTAFVHNSLVTGSNANGTYIQYASGVIDQWGETSASGPPTTVTFPIAFPNVCQSINITPIGQYASSLYITQPSASNTQFTISFVTGGTQFSWRASGK